MREPSTLVALLWLIAVCAAQPQAANPPPGANQNVNPGQDSAQFFTGTGFSPLIGPNLVNFGPEFGDNKVEQMMLTQGQTINLHMYFPFYGALYNYTTISVNGYLGFAAVNDQGQTINVGPSTNWPETSDPAMIAPYLCKQQVKSQQTGYKSGIYYRVHMRQSMFGRGSNNNLNQAGQTMSGSSYFGNRIQSCPNTGQNSYVRCDPESDRFLDEMMNWLQEGVAGAAAFRADAALVVTWYNMATSLASREDVIAGRLSTYQAIWLTDQPGRLSYVILNYHKLGYDASDVLQSGRMGRCQALFNGGNHTGLVPVDPTQQFKNQPSVLFQRSGVPHVVRGRYMFRVDDVVRPAGCSNKTGGTYPMLIYPNIVNMLGEMTVDVNGLCLDRTQTYVLMIEQRQTAPCQVLNSAIARCTLPKIYDWGTKTVYFQPQSTGANEEKAFVGYIYFVPPTLDPMRLEIGNIYEWFKNPLTHTTMKISWYPRNFTNPDIFTTNTHFRISDDAMYSVNLGLYVIGYKEARDDQIKKFSPKHRVIARLATFQNLNTMEYRWKPQEQFIDLNRVEHWYMNDWERNNELYTYRFGYLKLAPITANEQTGGELYAGLVSAPISLHWMWTSYNNQFSTTSFNQADQKARTDYITKKATEMCHDWYDEDGAQFNFIRDTETNASCPCVEAQAKMDIGRFMPHPRCSQTFRDVTCTAMIGASNCYMSAENIYGSYARSGNDFDSRNTMRFPTHYGQICCYDNQGKLMQTSYQPVIKVIQETPYNPGFPTRAYEFGTAPYMGQYEVPGLSAFHHDYMPYFLCCKFAKARCQMFYWRRPSSGCQQYQPPAIGEGMGAGTFNTIDNDKFVFNEPGVFTLLYIPQTTTTPEVRIQIRLERYPDRRVDFGLWGKSTTQANLVQPTNATVITGIAIEATGTDRVHVLARGDTRRFRYRTSVIVGNIMRYFDTMRIQRFKGVMVYVNNVERGQPEIYVVLEEAQIGIRIRESYAIDIDRLPDYQESMGMLDIAVSVPPQYGVRPDGDKTRETQYREMYDLPKVSGLLRPFPDQTAGGYQGLTFQEVNSESIRQQIIQQYRVPGSGEAGSNINQPGAYGNIPTSNMFTSSRDEDKKFDVFPEASMRSEGIYKAAAEYSIGPYRFHAKTGTDVVQMVRTCLDLKNRPISQQPMASQMYEGYGRHCPDHPEDIITLCGDNVPCFYDYAMINARVLGEAAMTTWDAFTLDRTHAIKQYNSCGPINIEYPEYMVKVPALASGYLNGDTARFECAQTHWIKGDYSYKCGLISDYNRQYSYRYEWSPKGEQPWCRSREKENFLKWLAAILGILGVIILLIMIFMCCWCVKENQKKKSRDKRVAPYQFNSSSYYPQKPSSLDETASHEPLMRESRAAHTPLPSKQPLLTPAREEPDYFRKEPLESTAPSTPSAGRDNFHGLITPV